MAASISVLTRSLSSNSESFAEICERCGVTQKHQTRRGCVPDLSVRCAQSLDKQSPTLRSRRQIPDASELT